jgi:acyl carrier protein
LALPAPPRTRPPLAQPPAAPRNATEEALADIWAEMLDLDCVGVHDQFLDLGGDSLLAVRILARTRVRFRAAIPDEAFFAAETVAEMATVIDRSPRFASGEDAAT